MRRPVLSLELLLDADAEARVREEWHALADAGLSSMAAHAASSNRPHVTLLVRPRLDRLAAPDQPGVAPLRARASPAVTLGAPLLFGAGERRVLARAVIPTRELLDLHSAVHAAAGPGDDAPHTRPGSWTPHVTLARRLPVGDLARALPLVGGDLEARLVGLRRWDAAAATVTDLGSFAGD